VETVTGTLHDHRALAQLTAGCQALVHCAGAVRGSNLEQFRHINTEGTRRVLQAQANCAQDARLLLISSLAAREPQLSWYAQSKREGEDLVAGGEGDWCVLRPPAVYGPGDVEMKAIFDMMKRGIALVPGAPTARNSLIHVSDLVEAVVACLRTEAAGGKILTVCDGKADGYDWFELAAIAAEIYRRPVRLLRLPGPMLDAVATINLHLARLTGRAPMLTPGKLRELRFPKWVVDNSEIAACTGWAPQIDLRSGLPTVSRSAL
jgi:nucleoside-diphosphate-sugar epimerase